MVHYNAGNSSSISSSLDKSRWSLWNNTRQYGDSRVIQEDDEERENVYIRGVNQNNMKSNESSRNNLGYNYSSGDIPSSSYFSEHLNNKTT